MLQIRPGTTPTLLLYVPQVDIEHATFIEVLLKQYPVQISKKTPHLVIDGHYIGVSYSEFETLIFRADDECLVEVKITTEDGRKIITDKCSVSVTDTVFGGRV